MAVEGVLRAVKTFFAGSRRVVVGELVKIDDEIMKGREHLFEAVHTGRNKPKPGPKPVAPTVTPAPAPAAPHGTPEAGGS